MSQVNNLDTVFRLAVLFWKDLPCLFKPTRLPRCCCIVIDTRNLFRFESGCHWPSCNFSITSGVRHLNLILREKPVYKNFLAHNWIRRKSKLFFFLQQGWVTHSDHYHLNTKCNAKATLQGTRQFSITNPTLPLCTNTNANNQHTRCHTGRIKIKSISWILTENTSSREIHWNQRRRTTTTTRRLWASFCNLWSGNESLLHWTVWRFSGRRKQLQPPSQRNWRTLCDWGGEEYIIGCIVKQASHLMKSNSLGSFCPFWLTRPLCSLSVIISPEFGLWGACYT